GSRSEGEHLGEDAAGGLDEELRVWCRMVWIREEALGDELSFRCANLGVNSKNVIARHPVRAARIQRIQDNIFVRIEAFLDELARRIVNDDCFLWLSLGDVV